MQVGTVPKNAFIGYDTVHLIIKKSKKMRDLPHLYEAATICVKD